MKLILDKLPKLNSLKGQWIKLSGVVLILFVVVGIFNSLMSKKKTVAVKIEEKPILVETADQAIDPDKMWRNRFEDKLSDQDRSVNNKLNEIQNEVTQREQQLEAKNKLDMEEMREQLKFATAELRSALSEIHKLREVPEKGPVFLESNVNSHVFDSEITPSVPKSSKNYIPETAYVTGTLLGGISVSTGMNSSTEPVPVVIRLTSRGSLPKNFSVNPVNCKIQGSAYGDLSSERAIIRAEVMSCTDPKTETIVTTKLAGVIYGDDGMNGIKGRMVQTNNKHLQNALIGGLVSGFAGTAKSQGQFAITAAGAVSTKKETFKDRLTDNSLQGLGSAGDKIADYYLRQAEAMSPVLLIPAGTKVDVVFTKGVYIGATDVRVKLANERIKNEGVKNEK